MKRTNTSKRTDGNTKRQGWDDRGIECFMLNYWQRGPFGCDADTLMTPAALNAIGAAMTLREKHSGGHDNEQSR